MKQKILFMLLVPFLLLTVGCTTKKVWVVTFEGGALSLRDEEAALDQLPYQVRTVLDDPAVEKEVRESVSAMVSEWQSFLLNRKIKLSCAEGNIGMGDMVLSTMINYEKLHQMIHQIGIHDLKHLQMEVNRYKRLKDPKQKSARQLAIMVKIATINGRIIEINHLMDNLHRNTATEKARSMTRKFEPPGGKIAL